MLQAYCRLGSRSQPRLLLAHSLLSLLVALVVQCAQSPQQDAEQCDRERQPPQNPDLQNAASAAHSVAMHVDQPQAILQASDATRTAKQYFRCLMNGLDAVKARGRKGNTVLSVIAR